VDAANITVMTISHRVLLLGAVLAPAAGAQSPEAVRRERTEFAEWLVSSAVSPWRAVVVRPIGPGLTVGPASADIPLAGIAAGRISERGGRIVLSIGEREIGLSRGRVQTVEGWPLIVNGPPGRATLTVFGRGPVRKSISHYPYDPKLVLVVTLRPATDAGTQTLLTPDGVEAVAGNAGSVQISLGGPPRTLQVKRLPGATPDESELEIYFRDATAGKGSYPAGRFVSLLPRADGKYILDFNRARNPFCAYNTVYPCPAPWSGNNLPDPVKAGERYEGGGLEVKLP
jgi:uncharacterized protein